MPHGGLSIVHKVVAFVAALGNLRLQFEIATFRLVPSTNRSFHGSGVDHLVHAAIATVIEATILSRARLQCLDCGSACDVKY